MSLGRDQRTRERSVVEEENLEKPRPTIKTPSLLLEAEKPYIDNDLVYLFGLDEEVIGMRRTGGSIPSSLDPSVHSRKATIFSPHCVCVYVCVCVCTCVCVCVCVCVFVCVMRN